MLVEVVAEQYKYDAGPHVGYWAEVWFRIHTQKYNRDNYIVTTIFLTKSREYIKGA